MDKGSALPSRTALRSLTDRQLVAALTTLAAFERAAIARLVAALAEFDRRRLFLPLGYTSLFAYCTNRLGLSQDEAFYRIEAARIARRFPVLLGYLEHGALTLTTARLLGPHLTEENHKGMLEAASHLKRPEVALLIARLKPKPDVPSTVRKLPDLTVPVVFATPDTPPPPSTSRVSNPPPASAWPMPETGSRSAGPVSAAPLRADGTLLLSTELIVPARRAIVAPLSESSYRLQITLSKQTHDTLRELQALIRHVIPNGDPAAIVARSLEMLLAHLKRKKTGETNRPRTVQRRDSRAGKSGRHIPARVRRMVWKRDAGRCVFVSADGVRCGADTLVEFHHVVPYSRGGAASTRNIQLRCRAHNIHEAEADFGARAMAKARHKGREKTRATAAARGRRR